MPTYGETLRRVIKERGDELLEAGCRLTREWDPMGPGPGPHSLAVYLDNKLEYEIAHIRAEIRRLGVSPGLAPRFVILVYPDPLPAPVPLDGPVLYDLPMVLTKAEYAERFPAGAAEMRRRRVRSALSHSILHHHRMGKRGASPGRLAQIAATRQRLLEEYAR